jgi:hypothetical protein
LIEYLDQRNENKNRNASKSVYRCYHLLWDYQLLWLTVFGVLL